ncbi:hypothetical protein [Jejuia pallidilutea]|uniref:Anti-sigma factor n=1 Tax=Jejuia pallidilutea TaxID=504487 RepID=A0A090W2M6_9FLAO|nr:hypothetical protein [Jejuia pallidilutea]GAL67466.1 hypothetical protein JCM19301_439 [Jejuia pallidilutea]GAL71265.1 hypothetical protein JCM19302_942 [Jejuia pallidilutea]GAL88754.1 hypothetical protein JCM19538_1189 [Jejuia pallidilutea]
MAQDIRDLFKNEKVKHEDMPNNHDARFLEKLEQAFPKEKKTPKYSWLSVAASVVVLIGISFGAYYGFQHKKPDVANVLANATTKTLGDVSPDLKKVEDYYLASINLELSKIKPTPETKVIFDGYLEQLNELNKEYKTLSLELTKNGATELTISALIDNLRFRLNLLYRLRDQLKTLNASNDLPQERTEAI